MFSIPTEHVPLVLTIIGVLYGNLFNRIIGLKAGLLRDVE